MVSCQGGTVGIDSKLKSGVYQIKNVANNKIYVGSSVNLIRRKREHITRLNCNTHNNTYLQRSWNKYGGDKFVFSILEYCISTKEVLLKIEQKYIDLLSPEYNLAKVAGSNLGLKRSKEFCENLSLRRKNKKASPESRKKMSVSQTGKKLSSITIAKQVIHRIKPVVQLNKDTMKMIARYESIKNAQINTGVDRASITKAFQGKLLTAGGFIWKLEKDYNA